jgi:hypothetical protein
LCAAYLAVALAIAFPAYITATATSSGDATAQPIGGVWILQAIVIAWSSIRLASLYLSGSPRLMNLTFWLYVYVFLGIAPWAQMSTGSAPGAGYATQSNELATTSMVLVGVAFYELAGFIARRTEARNRFTAERDFATQGLWILAFVGLAFSAYYIASVGFETLFQYRADRFNAATGELGGSQVTSIISTLAVIPTLIAAIGFIHKRREQGQGYLVMIPLLVIDVLLLSNPISSSRFTFGVYVGSLLIVIFKLTATPTRVRGLIVGALVVLVLVFPYGDKFRNDNTVNSIYSTQSIANQLSTKLDYDSYEQIALTDRYVASNGHTYGRQEFGALLAPVPRAVWSGKPEDTGVVLGVFAGYSFTSISAPLWAEAWIDGGWPWLALVFFGLGFVSSRLDSGYQLGRLRQAGALYGAVPVLALYSIMTLRGSLLQQMSSLMVIVVCFWVIARKQKDPLVGPRRRGRTRGSISVR